MKNLSVNQKRQRKKFFIIVIAIVLALLAIGGTAAKVSASPVVSKAQATEIQMILVHHGYVGVAIDGDYGRVTEKAVRQWQRANGLFVDGIPGKVTMAALRASINGPANASVEPAKRLNPPLPPIFGLNGLEIAPEGLDDCQQMVFYMQQAGLPDRFDDSGRHSMWVHSDGIGWRESKCNNNALSPNGCCGGYWQNYIRSHLSSQSKYRDRIINECQVTAMNDIRGDSPLQKQRQACVTKVVFDISGYSPWD